MRLRTLRRATERAEQDEKVKLDQLQRRQAGGCKDKKAADQLMNVDFGFREEAEQCER
jgi:hypothetical protein